MLLTAPNVAPNFKFGVFYFGEEKENKNSYAKNILMIGGDIGMIRVRFRTIIIPRGDTGFISFPNVGPAWDGDVAVFSLLDKMTRKTVLEKIVDASDESLFFYFNTEDTKDLEAKTYYWDIKVYKHPSYDEDNNLTGAHEINSFYSAFKLPECIIKEVAQNV